MNRRRAWWLVGVSVAAMLIVYARFAIIEPIQNWAADDLAINYSAANVLRAGGSIYDAAALRAAHAAYIGPPGHLYEVLFLTYNNPPLTAVLFAPLTLLPFPVAQTVFVLINNACYLLGLGLIWRALRARPLDVVLSLLLGVMLFYYAARQTFGLGQMNGLLVLMMGAAVMATVKEHDAAAGGWLALAAALKLSPAVLVLFFVARRRWRGVFGAVLVGGLLAIVMVMFTGSDTLGYFITQVLPNVGRGSAAFPNQSLLGALYRLTVPVSVVQSSDAIGDYAGLRLVWLLTVIGLGVISIWLVARATLNTRSRVAVALSSFLVLGLLAGSLTWDHYLLWLGVPISALIVDWNRAHWLRPFGFWGLLIVAIFAISLPIPFQAAFYHSIGPWASSISTLGLGLLFGLMEWRLAVCR